MKTFQVGDIVKQYDNYYEIISLECRYALKDESHQKLIERFKTLELIPKFSEEGGKAYLKKLNKSPLGHLFDNIEEAQKYLFQKDYEKDLAKFSKKSSFSFNCFNVNISNHFHKSYITEQLNKHLKHSEYGLTFEDYEIIKEDNTCGYMKMIFNKTFNIQHSNSFTTTSYDSRIVNKENFLKCVEFFKQNPF